MANYQFCPVFPSKYLTSLTKNCNFTLYHPFFMKTFQTFPRLLHDMIYYSREVKFIQKSSWVSIHILNNEILVVCISEPELVSDVM